MAVADAKIFAEPLQSATALRQPVRIGEELQAREPSAAISLAPPSRHGPTGFVQNEDFLAASVFAIREKAVDACARPTLVQLLQGTRSNEIPILRIFLGRCVAVLWQPWDSKDFGRERPTWPQQQMRPQEAIAFEMTTSG
jgi:hypothetical protein